MAAPILHGSVSAVSNRTERMMMRKIMELHQSQGWGGLFLPLTLSILGRTTRESIAEGAEHSHFVGLRHEIAV